LFKVSNVDKFSPQDVDVFVPSLAYVAMSQSRQWFYIVIAGFSAFISQLANASIGRTNEVVHGINYRSSDCANFVAFYIAFRIALWHGKLLLQPLRFWHKPAERGIRPSS
jgi:hypothetical protein